MLSDWRLSIVGNRATISRSVFTLAKPYLPLLAFTVLWYPLLGLLTQVWMPSHTVMGALFALPILGMVFWCPRLASERRRIVLEIDGTSIIVANHRLSRSQLIEVVLLPGRKLFQTRYRILVTFGVRDFVNFVQVASERHVEAARGLATELATWLGLPLTATASPPPTATLRPKP